MKYGMFKAHNQIKHMRVWWAMAKAVAEIKFTRYPAYTQYATQTVPGTFSTDFPPNVNVS